MSHMELEILEKGAAYSCDCGKCGATLYTQEWAYADHRERRDAMRAGALRCDHCAVGTADPDTFRRLPDQYAARLSAPGYLDCTEWEFDTNRRRLERAVRSG